MELLIEVVRPHPHSILKLVALTVNITCLQRQTDRQTDRQWSFTHVSTHLYLSFINFIKVVLIFVLLELLLSMLFNLTLPRMKTDQASQEMQKAHQAGASSHFGGSYSTPSCFRVRRLPEAGRRKSVRCSAYNIDKDLPGKSMAMTRGE